MEQKPIHKGLFVKPPDRDGLYRVISYTDGDGFVKCHGSVTVPLIDYLGRQITFTVVEEPYKP